MKEKIIIFVLGLLLGAVISTGSIYVYTLINKDSSSATANQSNMQMPGNMGEGQMTNGNMGGNPPSMPNDNNSDMQNGQNGQMNRTSN